MRQLVLPFLMVLIALFVVGCSGPVDGDGKNVLTGSVKINDQSAPEMAMFVVGPDGQTSGGTVDPTGRYTIPDPPQGRLEFYFLTPGNVVNVPERYTKPGNELTFEYQGGVKTYDMNLK